MTDEKRKDEVSRKEKEQFLIFVSLNNLINKFKSYIEKY